MNFSRGFLAARPHLTFLVGMGSAVGLAWHLESGAMQHDPEQIGNVSIIETLELSEDLPARAFGVSLSDAEVAQARVAWRYFENNYNEKTGFVNSADRYPSTTLWDLGSYTMGLLAVEDLGILSPEDFDSRMNKLLDSLMALPLVDGKLPN